MIKIKKGTDVVIKWHILTGTGLNTTDYVLEITDPRYQKTTLSFTVEDTDYIVAEYKGNEQKYYGAYSLALWKKIGDNTSCVDKIWAFELTDYVTEDVIPVIELYDKFQIGGVKGIQGEKGKDGPAGPQGEKGEPGPQGPQGIQGEKGDEGNVNAWYGTREEYDALVKADKIDENLFYYINDGVTYKGEKGDPFTFNDFTDEQLESLRGPKGVKGDKGLKGDKGDAFTYNDFTEEQLAGLKGDKGDTGEVDAWYGTRAEYEAIVAAGNVDPNGYYFISDGDEYRGEKGEKGDPFTYADFTAEQLEGLRGPKGDQGEKGDKGDAFVYSDFTEEQLAGLKGEKGDAFTYQDFTVAQLANLKGEKGDKGDAFTYEDFTEAQLEALTGPQGEQGIQGIQGETGATGAQGEKGEKGDPFTYADFTAEQLEGLRGPQGVQGETGPQGEKGDMPDYWVGTQDEYNELGTKTAGKFYFITEGILS